MREAEWLLLEADLDYLRSSVFPGLIERRLGNEYDVKVISRSGARIYGNAAERAGGEPDGSVGIFDVRGEPFGWRGRGGRREPPGANPGAGRWKLIARHRAGSLDLLVDQARLRNLGVASAILLLMLGTGAALIQSMRRMQQLASLQMEFVAGVSHELRTPLTVIRTAAYNLKGKVAANPAHVERYGALIQKESERLTTLVEDVLRFSSARGGQVIREREPVSLESVIEEGVDASRAALAESGCEVEKKIEPGLPLIMGDASALRHALQNLLGNAAKYGTDGGNWIGVSAMATTLTTGVAAVEVRVADRGPGIPAEEQERIFEPFFRGARAVADQIHGTGLGLNLVRKIVEAHKGSISVVSEPGKGAEFVMVIPAAPPEYQDEFSHSAG